MFSKVAIIGPGLLGGSIAEALRRRRPDARIHVWARRPEAVERVLKKGLADFASADIRECTNGAEIIVFCVVIGAMPGLAAEIAESVNPDAWITDVGSVKAGVVESLGKIFCHRGHFIGSHPMAGSEQAGLEAASGDLFDGAVCILTPEADSSKEALAGLTGFWELLGCRVATLGPAEHDEAVAHISHLPHFLAAALMNLVCARNPEWLNFCGNGFRDATRVAAGAPEMWLEIFQNNRPALKKSLEAMIEKLREGVKLLDGSDPAKMKEFLMEAKRQRDILGSRK